MSRALCVWEAGAALGEGPVWSVAEAALYWVDIKKPAVHRYTPDVGRRETFPMPEEIGCVGLRRSGGLVAGLRSGFAFLDLEAGSIERIENPEADQPGNRINDGACDPGGGFWAGTMDDACLRPTGSLYRMTADLSVTNMDTGYCVTNGPAWSPDGTTMYHNDTTRGIVYAFDYDKDAAALSNKRRFAEIPEAEGYPDGLTVDAEGYVWCALWGGWRVIRLAPDGGVVEAIELPAANVTSCAFGGPELRTLFVTTARGDLSEEELRSQTLAGGLFTVETGVVGLPAGTFAG